MKELSQYRLVAVHEYRTDEDLRPTDEYLVTNIRILDKDGAPLHRVGDAFDSQYPHRGHPRVTPGEARRIGELFAKAPRFLAVLEEIGAGNLDDESPEEFADRCRQLANAALRELYESKTEKGPARR